MKPVISEAVAAYEYESATLTLLIQFKNGSIYEYSGVPSDLAAVFDTPHPWHRVYARVKSYPCRQVS